jgi:hypothetical protein
VPVEAELLFSLNLDDFSVLNDYFQGSEAQSGEGDGNTLEDAAIQGYVWAFWIGLWHLWRSL